MNKIVDLTLYLVTQRGSLPLDDFFKIILQSVEGGVKIVQLREKETSTDEMITIGKKLHAFLKPLNIPLIINDRIDVALAIQAEGVHLGQSDQNVVEARRLLGKQSIIGLSVESIEQALTAEKADIDYIAASPVFSTSTKTDCEKPWGLEGLNQLCTISRHPVVAIGGINHANIESIFRSGASGAAIVSALFKAPCPKSAAQQLIQRIKNCHER